MSVPRTASQGDTWQRSMATQTPLTPAIANVISVRQDSPWGMDPAVSKPFDNLIVRDVNPQDYPHLMLFVESMGLNSKACTCKKQMPRTI